ncbi:MAG: hypothetical protein KKH95_01530 [Gammaproteobacteria bacterium]|nr:hypothetical protein [Gammaproteobacteria bacterium]
MLQSVFDKASVEVNGESFIKSTTPSKRSAVHALWGLLKKPSPVLPRFGVTRYAFNVAP